jgi:hypothetical protein
MLVSNERQRKSVLPMKFKLTAAKLEKIGRHRPRLRAALEAKFGTGGEIDEKEFSALLLAMTEPVSATPHPHPDPSVAGAAASAIPIGELKPGQTAIRLRPASDALEPRAPSALAARSQKSQDGQWLMVDRQSALIASKSARRMGWGDALHRIAGPIGRALSWPCLKGDGTTDLKPGSPCANAKDKLDQIKFPDALAKLLGQ